jgi:hypothetical protein
VVVMVRSTSALTYEFLGLSVDLSRAKRSQDAAKFRVNGPLCRFQDDCCSCKRWKKNL